nr:RNA-directed DNA polymerase, eukaryota [Tanacetum cinerariifolium]
MTNQEAEGLGSGIKRTRTYIPSDREETEQCLLENYFGNDDTPPKYPEENFRRMYRMSSTLFAKIVNDITSYDAQPLPEYFRFFRQRIDAIGRNIIGPILKITSAKRQLAYGTTPDASNEYLQIAERCSCECLDNFTKCIYILYVVEYLRNPSLEDIEKTYALHEEKHGLIGMLGSIDWSNNDLNVLYGSPLFDEVFANKAPEAPFVVNGRTYKQGYYLADGIYPTWSTFVKIFSIARDEITLKFKRVQESTRKDIERAFGVLQGLAQKAKKDWVKELCVSNKVNFLTLQETKMESMELITIKSCWSNYAFDYVHSDAVGNSGGILCVWDTKEFCKKNCTVSDYFVIVRGVWVKIVANLLIVAVYAPHDLKDKCLLWDYLTHVSNHWDEEVMMMGDFNEVRFKSDRFGSFFNERGADMFNSFISNASLEEVPLGGCAYTWCHKSASKMSKLDRFLISENLMHKCPNICAITLDRFISDHRPILLRESSFDYGPTPFPFYHYWMEMDGFNEFVIDSWRVAHGDRSNCKRNMLFKLKFLKSKIKEWINVFKNNSKAELIRLKGVLQAVDGDIGNGNWSDEVVSKRTEIINSMLHFVKDEFVQHFSSRFGKPTDIRASIDMNFHKVLWSVQKEELQCNVSKEELKRAVWDCGMDKSPGPDGFTFEFFRKFWSTVENDVYEAVTYFFTNGVIPKGCNSSFIALIQKIPGANMCSQMLTRLESQPEYGGGSGSGGCGDDEPGDDEDGGEDGEDEDDS